MSDWNDIIIGKGSKGNSAWLKRDVKSTGLHIAENAVSYWISGCYLDTGMTIFKDCGHGEDLTKLLNDASDEELVSWLNKLVINRIKPEVLMNKVQWAIERAFQDGQVNQADKIQKALML